MKTVDHYTIPRTRSADGSPALHLAGAVLFPGISMARRAPLFAALLFTVGVALPVCLAIAAMVERERIIAIALDRDFLLAVVVVGLAAVIVRFAAVVEVAGRLRTTRFIGWKASAASLVVGASGLAAVWVAVLGLEARAAVAEAFGEGSQTPVSAVAGSSDPDGFFSSSSVNGSTDASGPSASEPSAATETLTEDETERIDSVSTVLVLGADSGPGRSGRRTDTMMLVSVHSISGRTSIISIPRNLARLRFAPDTPLADRYPDGFDDLANALFSTVAADPELSEKYGADGFEAEPIALASAIGYSLGVEIDDFVLVDMIGFARVVDAVGGVTVELCQSVSLPPSLPGEPSVQTLIGPGEIDMNGVTALAYARTRYADSDYERTGRQRQLMAALGSQVTVVEAVKAFRTVTSVFAESLRTSLTVGEFDDLLTRLGQNSSIVESVGLVPPLVEPSSPDYDRMGEIVRDVIGAISIGVPSGYTRDVAQTEAGETIEGADACSAADAT